MAGQPRGEQVGVVVHTLYAVVRGAVDLGRVDRLSDLLNNV